MASRLLRRSGIACGLVAEVLGWRADLVVQVGVGHYHQEVDVLKEEWPGVQFIGFEPVPGMANDYPGELRRVAVGDKPGKRSFYVKRHHGDGSSLFKPVSSSSSEIEVDATTLDAEFPNGFPNSRVLLWLDCEGSELSALQGGSRFLTNVEMVNVEMTSKRDNPEYCSPFAVHQELLYRAGFVRQWVHTGRVTLGQYDAIYVRPALFRQEYCCDPWQFNPNSSSRS